MCTLTWLTAPHEYQVFFNRDELNTRQRALPPALTVKHGVRVVSPQDADAGGTWICTNEFGTTLCLLNNYKAAAAFRRDDWISRGQLVASHSHLPADAIIPAIMATNLERYRGFVMALFSLREKPRLLSWDGHKLTIESQPRMPVSSSSFDTDRVIARRMRLFNETHQRQQPDPSSLSGFHHAHGDTRSAYSVCMHRDDASTVSYSRIMVNANEVAFSYRDGSPCERRPESRIAVSVLSTPTSARIHRGSSTRVR